MGSLALDETPQPQRTVGERLALLFLALAAIFIVLGVMFIYLHLELCHLPSAAAHLIRRSDDTTPLYAGMDQGMFHLL